MRGELKPCPFCGGKAVRVVYWDEEEQNEKRGNMVLYRTKNITFVLRAMNAIYSSLVAYR